MQRVRCCLKGEGCLEVHWFSFLSFHFSCFDGREEGREKAQASVPHRPEVPTVVVVSIRPRACQWSAHTDCTLDSGSVHRVTKRE